MSAFSELGVDLAVLPSPLAAGLAQLAREHYPLRRIWRLIDCVEVFVKLHTAVAVSDFASLVDPDQAGPLRVMLAAGLERPSLGIWHNFTQEAAAAIARSHLPPTVPGLDVNVGNKGLIQKALRGGGQDLIPLRNRYAHGATPPDTTCTQDFEVHWPRLRDLIRATLPWKGARIVAVPEDRPILEATGPELVASSCSDDLAGLTLGHCHLVREGRAPVDLHPLLALRSDTLGGCPALFFYNDLQPNKATALNYEHSERIRDASLRAALLARYPIHEWSQIEGLEEFRERIAVLTETFKGRESELGRLVAFAAGEEGGFFMVWGGPGVGKSALLARSVQVLRAPPELRLEVCGTDVEGASVRVLEYFVRRGSTDRAEGLLNSLNHRLEIAFGTNLPFGQDNVERRSLLDQRLRKISPRLGLSERLVLFLDGLDEASGPDVIAAIPRDLPPRISAVLASRRTHEIESELFEELDRERRQSMTIGPLSTDDTRAVLFEHVDKYSLDPSYVDEVANRSKGNPLFLKLVCSAIGRGEFRLNQKSDLPESLDTLYRCALANLEDASLKVLGLLAAAHDYVSLRMMAALLDLPGAGAVERGPLAACQELVLGADARSTAAYQLFHESLREYLVQHDKDVVDGWTERLADWSTEWRQPNGAPTHTLEDGVRQYALSYAVDDLRSSFDRARREGNDNLASKRLEQVEALVGDRAWREQSFLTCGNAVPLQRALRHAQEMIAVAKNAGTPEAKAQRIVRYAAWMHEEGLSLRAALRDSLLQQAREGNIQLEWLRIANIGETPGERVALLAEAMWNLPAPAVLPPEFEHTVARWLEDARDPAITALWDATLRR